MTTAREAARDGGGVTTSTGPATDVPDRPARFRCHVLAVAVYVLLTAALTWPLVSHVTTKIAIHRNYTVLAPYYHFYLVAWYHHTFDRGLADYWHPNIFYPHPHVLTYFESLSAAAAMTWPAHLASHNATLCYNLVVLGAFVLNGLGTYVLALRLGLSWRVALFAGGAMAFCPYMFGEIYCLATLLLYPAPLLLAAIHRLMDRPTWPAVILVGVCGLWLLATCYQYALFCSLFCAGWMLWFVRRMPWRRLWYKLLVVGAVCAALAMPMLWTVKRTHKEMGFYHGPTLPMSWLQMLVPATQQRLYRDALGIRVRQDRGDLDPVVCFPGLTFGLLAAVGAWAVLFGAADTDDARRRRHAYRFCLAASVAAVLLAMGLWIRLGPIKIPGPYALLFLTLSPFSSVRSVYRFYIFGQLFAAILAGLGLRRCLGALSTTRARRLVAGVAVCLLLVESIWIPLRLEPTGGRPADVHPLIRRVADLDPNAPFIQLPIPTDLRRSPLDALYIADSIHTWQPMVNGFASYWPGLYEELRPVMAEFPSFKAIRYLRALGVRYVLVHESLWPKKSAESLESIKRFTALREIQRHDRSALYELTESARRSLAGWQGKTRFDIERNPKSKLKARGSVSFELDLREVIPVLPGDPCTRWTLRWRDASDQVIQTQTIHVRDSHWLTHEQDALTEPIELPAQPGTYTVEAVDQRCARKLGSCDFQVK